MTGISSLIPPTIAPSRAGWWRPDRPIEAAVLRDAKEPGSPIAFAALVAFTFVLLLAPQSFIPILRPLRIALLSALVAIGSHLLYRALRCQPLMRLTREMVLAAALAGWAVATVPLSYWPGGSVALLLDLYFKAFAIFWLLSNVVTTKDRLRFMCWTMTLMAVPLALVGIENYLVGEYAPGTIHVRIAGYDGGLTRNPNDLALMLNLLLPLSVALLGSVQGTARTALVGVILLDVVAIILTFSRAGFLTLATSGAILTWGLARRRRWGPIVSLVALGVFSLPFLPRGYGDRLATIVDIESDPTGSAQERWNDTRAAVGFVLDNPIVGAGAGMNILALNEIRGVAWKSIHNAYLEYAVDLGLPGLVLFVLLLWSCFRTVGAVRKRCRGSRALRELGSMAHGIQVSLAAFAVAAWFHPVGYQFYFFYIAGLAVAARGAYETETGRGLLAS
jgi:hypothetical protein